jgi:hypothetical protein
MTARFWALLLLAPACAPRPAGDAGGSPRAAAAASERLDSTLVTLARTPCYGACPVYSVTISGAGEVRFTGTRHTTHVGEAAAEIPPARVDSLIAELRAGGYFGFADAYVADAPACGRYATDSPSVVTSVLAGGVRKEIRHDYGCSEAPSALAGLERRIDEVAGTARWTGR